MDELADEDEYADREAHLDVLVREVARVVDVDVGRDHVARGVHAGVDEAAAEGSAQRGGDPVQAHEAEVRRRLGEGGGVRARARGLAEEEARVRDEYDAAEQGPAGHRRRHAANAEEVRSRRGLLKVVRNPEQKIQSLKEQDHPRDVDRPRELEGDDGGGAQKPRHGPALEVELKEKRRCGKHRHRAAEPIMLAKEHEEPAEAVEDRAKNSRYGRLAEAGEQVIEKVGAQDDLERLGEHEHKAQVRVAKQEPHRDHKEVEGVEEPRLVGGQAHAQTVLEAPGREGAVPEVADEVAIEGDVLLDGVGPGVRIGEHRLAGVVVEVDDKEPERAQKGDEQKLVRRARLRRPREFLEAMGGEGDDGRRGGHGGCEIEIA